MLKSLPKDNLVLKYLLAMHKEIEGEKTNNISEKRNSKNPLLITASFNSKSKKEIISDGPGNRLFFLILLAKLKKQQAEVLLCSNFINIDNKILRKAGVYCFTVKLYKNNYNNKNSYAYEQYIGSSINFPIRLRTHKEGFRKKSKNVLLYNSNYGLDCFIRGFVFVTENRKLL